MAITETAAASSAAAEAADAAVHGPDLSMGTEHLTDAIADTTNYFVVFFEKLLEGLTWGNVLFQLCVIVVAVLAGLMCSKLVRSVVARHMPPHELKERFTQRMKRLALSVVNAIAFGLAAGSVTACCAYGAVMMGYQASSLVLLKVAYSFFYAYSLLAIVLGLLQAMVGSSIISPRITKSIVVTFWILAILQFFGVLTHLVDVLDATAIPIGSGNMTVWKLFMAVCSVLLTVAAANWISEMIEQTITDAKSLTGNIKVVLGRVVRIFLMVIAVIIGLGTVGIDLTILSVFGGALGVGLGFGLQKIASNYVSGFIILLDKSVKIGDLVTVGGFTGKVTEINTRFTVVRSLDGIENIVPNEAFVTSAVLNHSYTDEANTQYVAVTIDFNADVDRALAVMLEEVSRDRPRIVKGRKPWAYVDSFGDSGINLKAAFWLADPVNGSVGIKTAITLDIVRRFREEGIRIPYNRLEVVMLDPHADDDAPADVQPKGSSAAV